jgi:hypothetical protein
MKPGDKVWVQAEVIDIEGSSVRVQGPLCSGAFWVVRRDCKPVETEAVEQPLAPDPVNPSHCKQESIECIEEIKAALGGGFIAYLWGSAYKYIWRWPNKNGIEDLKKARWYLDRLIQEEEAK